MSIVRTVQSQLNKVLYFNGVDNYIKFSASSSLDVRYSFSVLAWVMPVTDSDFSIFSWQFPRGTWGTHVWRVWQALFTRIVGRRGEWTTYLNVGSIPTKQWSFPASTYDYNSGVVKHYVNTSFAGQLSIGSYELSTNGDAYTGKVPWDARALNGFIAQILVYSRPLSISEITYNMLNPNSPLRDGLVLWLDARACDTSSNICYDLSGNNNHGTIYGAQVVTLPSPVRAGGTL
jgi:hypothetical protein